VYSVYFELNLIYIVQCCYQIDLLKLSVEVDVEIDIEDILIDSYLVELVDNLVD
jgi:hypothetical protein